MSGPTLYDDDILLWSEEQAAAIRKLGAMGDISNDLDIENVAEEIESVGRSELAAVADRVQLIFFHLMEMLVAKDARSERNSAAEIVGLHWAVRDRYSPSMRQRVDLGEIWRSAGEQSMLTYEGAEQQVVAALSSQCPFSLDDLLAERIDSFALVKRLRAGATSGS